MLHLLSEFFMLSLSDVVLHAECTGAIRFSMRCVCKKLARNECRETDTLRKFSTKCVQFVFDLVYNPEGCQKIFRKVL